MDEVKAAEHLGELLRINAGAAVALAAK